MTYYEEVEFIETGIFTKIIHDYMTDDEFCEVQNYLAENPQAGDPLPGGLRKLRWRGKGKGKRGGFRIIHYWINPRNLIYLITIYAKSEREDLPPNQMAYLVEWAKELRKEDQ